MCVVCEDEAVVYNMTDSLMQVLMRAWKTGERENIVRFHKVDREKPDIISGLLFDHCVRS